MKFLLVLAGAVWAMLCGAAALEIKEFKHGEFQCIRAANKYFDLTIIPDSGGRIIRWHNRISNVTYADVKQPLKKSAPPQMGGLLDDRGFFWYKPYHYIILRNGDKSAEIIMSCTDTARGVKITKNLLISADSPVIAVKYKYENHGQEMVFGFDTGQRNFLLPGGEAASEDIRYFIPTTHTLRRRKGFSFKMEDGRKAFELATKLSTAAAAPYHGLLSVKKQCGLAISHRDDFFVSNFIWKAHIEHPTYEWMFGELPAGHSRETAYDIIQLDGIGGISFADHTLVADMRLTSENEQLAIQTQLKFLQNCTGKLTLRTDIRKIASPWKKQHLATVSGCGKFQTVFPLAGSGLYDVKQSLLQDGKTLAVWHEALALGKGVEYEPIYKMKFRGTTENLPIPGWKGVPLPELKFDKRAWQQKGFALAILTADNQFTECKKLALTIARNEYESREIVIYPAFNSGVVSVSGTAPAGVDFKLCRLDQLVLGGKSGGMKPRYAKLLRPGSQVSTAKPVAIVLVFGGKNSRPGSYKFTLTFAAQSGKSRQLPVEVTVSPVALPERKLIMLEAEGYPCGFPRARQDAAVRDAYLENMASHGIDFFQYGGRGISERDIPMLEAFLDAALSKGITRFKTARYDISVPKASEVKSWQRLYDFVTSKGIQKKDIFVKIKDEQPADQYPKMAETGKWLKEIGFRPFSTFSEIFYRPRELRLLYPVFDMYQGGVGSKSVRAKRRQEGLFKNGDLVGTYTGWGTCWQPYMQMVPFGIQAFVHGHDFFHNHEYMRGGNQRLGANMIRIGDDFRPEDSLAFEGLRDGMEVANMAALAQQWLKIAAEDTALADNVAPLQKQFDHLFSRVIRVSTIIRNGYEIENVENISLNDYLMLREALLKLLTDLRALTIASVDKYAKVSWNDHILLDAAQSFVCSGDATGGEIFRTAFAGYFNVSLKRPGRGVVLEFRRAAGKRSYTITQAAPDKIVITAADDAGFRKAAACFLRCMDVSGIWL